MVEKIFDTHLRAILQMHNVLHGFRDGRGTGMSIMELKLAQLLSQIDPDRLFLVLLELQKAYDAVDRDLLLITLEGCGSGSRMCGLLENFWDYQQVVPRHNGFRRPSFPTTRGTFQGRLVSLTLFNVVVDSVIRKWMDMTVEDQRVAQDRLGETVGRCVWVFYADVGMVVSRDL